MPSMQTNDKQDDNRQLFKTQLDGIQKAFNEHLKSSQTASIYNSNLTLAERFMNQFVETYSNLYDQACNSGNERKKIN